MRVVFVLIGLLIVGAAGFYVSGYSLVLINNVGDHTVTLKARADGALLAQAAMHSRQWNWFLYRTSKTASLSLRCDDPEGPALSGIMTSDFLSPGKSQGIAIKIEDCTLVSTKVIW